MTTENEDRLGIIRGKIRAELTIQEFHWLIEQAQENEKLRGQLSDYEKRKLETNTRI